MKRRNILETGFSALCCAVLCCVGDMVSSVSPELLHCVNKLRLVLRVEMP